MHTLHWDSRGFSVLFKVALTIVAEGEKSTSCQVEFICIALNHSNTLKELMGTLYTGNKDTCASG